MHTHTQEKYGESAEELGMDDVDYDNPVNGPGEVDYEDGASDDDNDSATSNETATVHETEVVAMLQKAAGESNRKIARDLAAATRNVGKKTRSGRVVKASARVR
jgi:hypothetical protein